MVQKASFLTNHMVGEGVLVCVLPLPLECYLWEHVVQVNVLRVENMDKKPRTFNAISPPKQYSTYFSVAQSISPCWSINLKHSFIHLLTWRQKSSPGPLILLVDQTAGQMQFCQVIGAFLHIISCLSCVASWVSKELSMWVLTVEEPPPLSEHLGCLLFFPQL